MEFVFLNEDVTYTTNLIEIIPLPDINKKLEFLRNNFYIKNGWIYPPIKYDEKGNSTRPVDWFGLPNSHKFILKFSKNKDLKDFMPIFFGFLKGLHLFRDGWGHYYKTPIKEGKLTQFHCTTNEICMILDKVMNLYKDNYDIFKNYYSAVHWFLFGQSYSHGFEKFDAQYRVLDCCYKISSELNHINKARNHAERIKKYVRIIIFFYQIGLKLKMEIQLCQD